MTDQDQGQDPQQSAATTPGFTTSQPQAIPDNAFAGAQGAPTPPARPDVTDFTTGDSAPDPRPPPTPNPGIMDFVTGKGAADPRQLTSLVDAAKRAGASNDSEAVVHAIGTAPPEQQGPLIQTARNLSGTGLAHAAAASNAGDLDRSGKFATAAMGYIPDGNDVKFQAGKDGMTATVTGLGDTGKTQSFKMNPQNWHSYITGPDVKFDSVMDGDIQKGLAKAGGEGGTQEGGSAATAGSQTGEAAGPPNPKRPYGEDDTKGMPPENPATRDPNEPGTGGMAPWRREPTFTNPDDKKEDESDGPINVVKFGKTSQAGNASKAAMEDPGGAQAAREANPNNPAGQVGFAGAQASTAAEQQNKLDVAKEKGANDILKARETGNARRDVATTAAGASMQNAVTKAQAVMSGTDKRFDGEQGRDAANILKQMMHDNPGAPIGDQITALRKGNINDKLIAHLVNPTPQVDPNAQQAPAPQQNATVGAPPSGVKTWGGKQYTRGPNGEAVLVPGQ